MLKLGSPAVGGAAGNDAPAFDQHGEPRPALGGLDLGAIERQPNDRSLPLWLYVPIIRR